jgi:hypothetical protein
MSLWKEPIYTPSKVEPTLTDAKTVTAGVAWVLGNAVKMMDANTSDKDFIVNHISIEYCDIWEYFFEEEL